MKKDQIPSVLLLILSLLIVLGGRTLFFPCVHEDGAFGTCHWAGVMLQGLGFVLGALSVLSLCIARARLGVYLSALPLCVLGLLTPGTLIPLCRMRTMRCWTMMRPAMMRLFSAALVVALLGAVLTERKQQKR